MNTELEIQEIIKKNLPAQVGDVLKQRLEQADKDAKKVSELENKISQLEKSINDKNAELGSYKVLDERNSKLNEREIVLNKQQHDLDLEILKMQLESEKDKSGFVKSIALGLVRNTEYRKTVFDSENQAPYYEGQNYIVPTPVNKSLNENSSAD